MKTKLLIGLCILSLIVVSGCEKKECNHASQCCDKEIECDCIDGKCVQSEIATPKEVTPTVKTCETQEDCTNDGWYWRFKNVGFMYKNS